MYKRGSLKRDMKGLTVGLVLCLLGTVHAQDKLLSESEIVLVEPLPEKNACIANQTFKKIGPAKRNLYAHELVIGYRYNNQPAECPRTSIKGALYVKEAGKYREIYDYDSDPAGYITFSIYEQNPFLVFSSESNDGGGIQSVQHYFVIDKDNKLHGIDISGLEIWVNSQLKQGQRIVELDSGIDFSKQPIKFWQRIFNEKDHYRHPTGGTLSANLSIVLDKGSYKLKLMSVKNKVSARDLNEAGLRFYRKKQYKKAAEKFKAATDVNKTYWMAWNNLSLTLYKDSEYKKSVDASWTVYTGRGVSRKSMANAAYNIAKSYEALGNLPHALKFYQSANELVPSKARKNAIEAINIKIRNK